MPRAISEIAVPVAADIKQQLQELTDIKPAVVALRGRLKQQNVSLNALKGDLLRCLKGEKEVSALPMADLSVHAEADGMLNSLSSEITAFDERTRALLRGSAEDLVGDRHAADDQYRDVSDVSGAAEISEHGGSLDKRT